MEGKREGTFLQKALFRRGSVKTAYNKIMEKTTPDLKLVTSVETDASKALQARVQDTVPHVDWLDQPETWEKKKFINDTKQYILDLYGHAHTYDHQLLTLLADYMETYIACNIALKNEPLIALYNGGKTYGPNPHFAVRTECLKNIIKMLSELGLTPKSKLTKNKPQGSSSVAKLLRGPKG